jgi:FxsC-like protein
MCTFFFSYSHIDKSPYLDKFYKELENAVKQRIPEAKGQIGFRDEQSLGYGDRWPEKLVSALSNACVFVALYSPTYFTREYCGKEWAFFQRRIRDQFKKETEPLPPLIIPVLWLPFSETFKLHPAAKDIHYKHDKCPDIYFMEGMERLVKKEDNAYVDVLSTLADKIAECNKNFALEPTTNFPNFNKVTNAFTLPAIEESRPIIDIPPGPNQVIIVSFVGTKAELEGTQQNIERYGHTSQDWKPYFPDDTRRVIAVSQNIVTTMNYITSHLSMSNDIIDQLETFEDQNNIVLIIIDLWSMKVMDRIRNYLISYDKHQFLHCSIMVPWNILDGEFERDADHLKELFNKTIFKTINKTPQTVNIPIESFDDLSAKIKNAVANIRDLLVEKAKVGRSISSDINIPLPEIVGPGGDEYK